MIDREQALALLTSFSPDQHLVNHAVETEAVMRGLAGKLGQDPDLWGIAGLLHDVDFPMTKDAPARHGLMAMDILTGKLPDEALQAIRAHNAEHTGQTPETNFDFALRAAESATGLVSANAMVRPERMRGMKPKSLKKKMKEKAFAANVDRGRILECEKLGLELGDFFQVAIDAFEPIAADVGLA